MIFFSTRGKVVRQVLVIIIIIGISDIVSFQEIRLKRGA